MGAERSPAADLTPFELGFDPGDIGFVANPYPVYERLRGLAPIVYDPNTEHWLVTRYEDVSSLLRDRRFGRTYLHVATHEEMGHPQPPPQLDPFWHLINHGILDMEPPDHTRVRRLVAKAFTPRIVQRLEGRMQEITESLLDEALAKREVDLVASLTYPLPVTVIAEMRRTLREGATALIVDMRNDVSDEAIDRCRKHGIGVIPGGCPMMHCVPVDPGHACMRTDAFTYMCVRPPRATAAKRWCLRYNAPVIAASFEGGKS